MKKIILILTLFLLIGVNLPILRVLSISDYKNSSRRFYSRLAVKQGFSISYTHSVNKGRVHDFYAVAKNGDLELFMTEFVSYGAGISEASETCGATFRATKNGYAIENLHRRLKNLVMTVGVVANHSFVSTNPDFPLETDFTNERFLKDFFAAQTSLVFETRRVSLLGYFFAKKI